MIFSRILTVAICLLLLLSGCGTKAVKTPLSTGADNGAATESPTPAPTGAQTPAPTSATSPTPLVTEAVNPVTPTPEPTTGSISNAEATTPPAVPGGTVITEDEIRAMYKGEYFTLEKITPYSGDYLVQYGDGPWLFDWVYGKTGERHKIMMCISGVLECEILETGKIRVFADGVNCEYSSHIFPYIQTGYLALELDASGKPLPYEKEQPNSGTQKYWADIAEDNSLGSKGRREVLTNALIDLDGAEFAFGPPADFKGLSAFYTATSKPPRTDISLDEEARVMTLTFRDTLLSSGDIPDFSDEQEERLYQDWLRATEGTFPTEFPAGELNGSNPYISRATIEEDGNDTVAKLYLTEKATEYTVETGKVGPMDNGPYIRIILREHDRWGD